MDARRRFARRSVRRYEDKPVPRELLKEIVDCAFGGFRKERTSRGSLWLSRKRRIFRL